MIKKYIQTDFLQFILEKKSKDRMIKKNINSTDDENIEDKTKDDETDNIGDDETLQKIEDNEEVQSDESILNEFLDEYKKFKSMYENNKICVKRK